MKHVLRCVCCLAFFLALQEALAQQKAVLSGRISNPIKADEEDEEEFADSIYVSLHRSYLDPKEELIGAPVDKKGNFRLEVALQAAQPAELLYGEEVVSLYLQPGTALEVKFNNKNLLKSISFKGTGAAENNFLSKFVWEFEEDEAYHIVPYNITMREAEFSKFLDKRKAEQLDFLESKSKGLSSAFIAHVKAEIEYLWANDKLTYPDVRERVVLSENRLKLSPEYYHFIQKLDLNNPANLRSASFQQFLTNYTHYLAYAAGYTKNHRDYYKTSYDKAKETLQGEVRELALSRIVYQSFRNGSYSITQAILQDYAQLGPKPEYMRFLNTLNTVTNALALGRPAPAFTLTALNGEKVSLSDFKGKVVYLNFWKPECGLCLVDMPYGQLLEEKLKDKNVVFLNVSMNDDEAAWRSTVSSRKIGGINLLAKGKTAELMQLYNLTEVPGYFLVNEDGTLLNTRPKRPSHSEAYNDLLKVLEKKN